ncbi:hypothetical protein DSECCO2_561060 [anaerobic digester metagenome]
MKRDEGAEEDEDGGRGGRMEDDLDRRRHPDPVQGEKDEPGAGLERDQDQAGGDLAPERLGEGDGGGEQGLQGPLLVLLGDEIDDQRRRDDRRHQHQEGDEQPEDELVELRPPGGGHPERQGPLLDPVSAELAEISLVRLEDALQPDVQHRCGDVVLEGVERQLHRIRAARAGVRDVYHGGEFPLAERLDGDREVHPVDPKAGCRLEPVQEGRLVSGVPDRVLGGDRTGERGRVVEGGEAHHQERGEDRDKDLEQDREQDRPLLREPAELLLCDQADVPPVHPITPWRTARL